MNDEALKDFKNHHMMIKNRESLDVTGIKKIECLNTNEFILETVLGQMVISGKDLEMTSLNIEAGELSISGYVNSITYADKPRIKEKKENIFAKLFK